MPLLLAAMVEGTQEPPLPEWCTGDPAIPTLLQLPPQQERLAQVHTAAQ